MRCSGDLGRCVGTQPLRRRILGGIHTPRNFPGIAAASCKGGSTTTGHHAPPLVDHGAWSFRLATSWRPTCPSKQQLVLPSRLALFPRSLPSRLTSSAAGLTAAHWSLLPLKSPAVGSAATPTARGGSSRHSLSSAHGAAAAATSSHPVAFYATCHPGLEQVVAGELKSLGYPGVEPSKAGVAFRGRRVSDGYAANLWLRSAIRVLVLLAEGRLGTDPGSGRRGGQAMYDLVYGAASWHELLPPGQTFSVEPRLWDCTDISSTRLVWSRVKDAVCDSIRQHRPDKPQPPEPGEVADVPLYVSCYRDTVKIFRDMSGESLHRRGYRDVMHRAALNEAAAAGVLALSGWREAVEAADDGEGLVLADPMCGSGTLLIEAALVARNIAPGLMRSLDLQAGPRRSAPLKPAAWPFQRWGDYDAGAWAEVVSEARERVRRVWRGRLLGVDVHEGALSLAVRQAKAAGVYGMLELTHGDCGSVIPKATPQLVVCNPPWGGRLDSAGDAYGEGPGVYDTGVALSGRGGTRTLRGAEPLQEEGGGGCSEADRNLREEDAYLSSAWRSLDGFLYRHCPGATASLSSGNASAFRYLKLKPQAKHRLVLSGVDVQVATYKIRDAAGRTATSTRSGRRSDGPEPLPTVAAPAIGEQRAGGRGPQPDAERPAAALPSVPATKRRPAPVPAASHPDSYADDGYWDN